MHNTNTLARSADAGILSRVYQLRINETLSIEPIRSLSKEGKKEGRKEDNCREGASNDRAKYRQRWHSLKMLEGPGMVFGRR